MSTVKTFSLTINAPLKVEGGFTIQSGCYIVGGISATDFSNPEHDVIGFRATPYKSKADFEIGEQPIRVVGLNETPKQNSPMAHRGNSTSFGGYFTSKEFTFDVSKGEDNKIALTVESMDSFKAKIAQSVADKLQIQVTDID